MPRNTAVLASAIAVLSCGGTSSTPPDSPATLTLSAQATTVAGAELVLSVAGTYSGTIRFKSSDPQGVLPADASVLLRANEQRTFAVVLKTAGDQTIQVIDGRSSAVLGIAHVAVSAGGATQLQAAVTTSCAPYAVELIARDPFGNVDPGYRGRVQFASARVAVPAGYQFTADDAGRHVFPLSAAALEVRTIVASDDAGHVAPRLSPPGWCGVGPDIGMVNAVGVEPGSPPTIYAGTFGGVYRSTDTGATWSALDDGILGQRVVRALAIAPGDPATIYLATFSGLYSLRSGADRWTLIGPSSEVTSIALDPGHPGVLYIGTGPGPNGLGVLRSLDGGQTWTAVNTGLPPRTEGVTAIAVDPATGAAYATFGVKGVFRTGDQGQTWSAAGLAGNNLAAVAVTGTGTVIVGSDSGFFASTDGGAKWTASPLNSIFALTPSARDPQVVYAATVLGPYWTQDDGKTWSSMGVSAALAITPAPDSASTFYLGTPAEGVLRTLDDGVSWLPLGRGLRSALVLSLATGGPQGATLYAGTGGGWIFSSIDHGETWNGSRAHQSADIESIVVDPQTPSTLYATGYAVLKSTDSGASWTRTSTPPDAFVRTLAIDPTSPARLYAGVQDGLLLSADGGASWTRTTLGDKWVYSIAVEGGGSGRVFATTNQGFFRSTDDGATWAAVGEGLPALQEPHPVLLVPGTGALLVGANNGIYRSVDHGTTFSPMFQKLAYYILALAIDPVDPRVVYGSSVDSVVKTDDGGQTWRELTTGLPPAQQMRALLVDPTDSSIVYGATYGMSVYRTLSGGD